MSNEIGTIKVFEDGNCIRIEISGDKLKAKCPTIGLTLDGKKVTCCADKAACCESDEKKEEGEKCC